MRKRSLSKAELCVSDGQANNPDSASFADRSQFSSTLVERPLSACELSLDIGQANTPDSASFVMRKLLQQLELPPVEITADLGSGGMTFGGRGPFRVDNIRKREMSQGDSDARKKSAGLADITQAKSFNFAREVREASSFLSAYSSELVWGMTASIFNDKSQYALKLRNKPVMNQ